MAGQRNLNSGKLLFKTASVPQESADMCVVGLWRTQRSMGFPRNGVNAIQRSSRSFSPLALLYSRPAPGSGLYKLDRHGASHTSLLGHNRNATPPANNVRHAWPPRSTTAPPEPSPSPPPSDDSDKDNLFSEFDEEDKEEARWDAQEAMWDVLRPPVDVEHAALLASFKTSSQQRNAA
jgi:hypothetical protein